MNTFNSLPKHLFRNVILTDKTEGFLRKNKFHDEIKDKQELNMIWKKKKQKIGFYEIIHLLG